MATLSERAFEESPNMNIIDFIRFGKKDDFTNFFDYPAEKRKKIIVRSARRGAEIQLALVKRYEMKYRTK